MAESFWFNDISILFHKKYISNFFPCKKNTLETNLNAIVRFSIYLTIIIYLYKENENVFLLPMIVMFITILWYKKCNEKSCNQINNSSKSPLCEKFQSENDLDKLILKLEDKFEDKIDEKINMLKKLINKKQCLENKKSDTIHNKKKYQIDFDNLKKEDIDLLDIEDETNKGYLPYKFYHQNINDETKYKSSCKNYKELEGDNSRFVSSDDREAFALWCYAPYTEICKTNTSYCMPYSSYPF